MSGVIDSLINLFIAYALGIATVAVGLGVYVWSVDAGLSKSGGVSVTPGKNAKPYYPDGPEAKP